MPHEIRLAGPWEFSIDEGSTWSRCSLPFDAASQCETTGETSVRIRRRFHRPSGLEQSSIVSIIVVANGAVTQFTLNDCEVVATTIARDAVKSDFITNHFHVSELLNDFNTLHVTFAVDEPGQTSAVDAALLRIDDDDSVSR